MQELKVGDVVGHAFAPYAIVSKIAGDQVEVEYWSYDHAVATVPRAALHFIGRDETTRAWWLGFVRAAPDRYGYTEDMRAPITEAAKDARLQALDEAWEAIDRRNEKAE